MSFDSSLLFIYVTEIEELRIDVVEIKRLAQNSDSLLDHEFRNRCSVEKENCHCSLLVGRLLRWFGKATRGYENTVVIVT